MNIGNNKQSNFAVEFISLDYSIMYLSFLFLNLSTNVSRSLSDSLSFPSMDIFIRALGQSEFLTLFVLSVIEDEHDGSVSQLRLRVATLSVSSP
jgi:hypothetical protein